MAESRGKIGEAYVELKADPSKLQQDLNAARTTVERETAAMGDAADKQIGGGFDAAGRKIQDATSGVRRFSSAITSTVGIVTGLIGSLTAVVSIIGGIVLAVTHWERKQADVRKRAEEAQRTYEGIRDQLDDQLRILQGVDAAQVDYERRWQQIKQLQEEGKLELIQSEDILKRMNAVRFAEIGAQRKAKEELDQQRAQAYEDFLRNKAAEVAAAKKADEEVARERREREEEDRKDREQREADSAKRQAEAFASAMERAFAKIHSAQTFQQNIAGPIEEMTSRIVAELRTLRLRGGG